MCYLLFFIILYLVVRGHTLSTSLNGSLTLVLGGLEGKVALDGWLEEIFSGV